MVMVAKSGDKPEGVRPPPLPESKPVQVDAVVRGILEPLVRADEKSAKELTDALVNLSNGLRAVHSNIVWLVRKLVLARVVEVTPQEKADLGLPVSKEEWMAAGVKPKAAEKRAG